MLTIINLDTGERVTCDHPEDIPALITPWFPDAPEEVTDAVVQSSTGRWYVFRGTNVVFTGDTFEGALNYIRGVVE